MPDEIQSAPAADTSSSNSSASSGAPAASGADTSPNLADVFTQNDQTPGSAYTATPPAPGVPAAQSPQAPATADAPQGEGPQTTAPTAPVDGATPPAGETPAATVPPAPAPAPAPDPQLVAAQQELAQLRAQSELHTMSAELGIHPAQIPAWGQYAKDMGFGTDIRAAFGFNEEVNASKSRIAENEAALIAPYVNDGYSEEDAKAAIKPMQDQFARTEQMLVENKRVAETSRVQLEAMRATEARVQQEGIARERNEAIQYASQTWGAAELPKNLAEIFAGSPAESIRLLADDVETLFQSRLASEKSKWAASYQERANAPTPMGANTGASSAANTTAPVGVEAPDLADIFNSNNNGNRGYAFA